jgi:hypothetical protein
MRPCAHERAAYSDRDGLGHDGLPSDNHIERVASIALFNYHGRDPSPSGGPQYAPKHARA